MFVGRIILTPPVVFLNQPKLNVLPNANLPSLTLLKLVQLGGKLPNLAILPAHPHALTSV